MLRIRWPGSGDAHVRVAIVAALLGVASVSGAGAPSIDALASRARLEHVALSPDGARLALIQTQDDRGAVVVVERATGARKVVVVEPDNFHARWCRWATNTRVVCSLAGVADDPGARVQYAISRLVAVNADGSNAKVLLQNSETAVGQFQDRVLAWRTGTPDTVLVQADEGISDAMFASGAAVLGSVGTVSLPAVWELNILTDKLKMVQKPRAPIRWWVADVAGQPRLGEGLSGATTSYYARRAGDADWRKLERSATGVAFEPFAISAEEPDKAYAWAPHDGRRAAWLLDLADAAEPRLLFSHPEVDVEDVLFGRDGRLVGYRYVRDAPELQYVDARVRAIANGLGKAFPGQYVEVLDWSDDGGVYLVRTSSDVDPPTFLLFERATGTVTVLANPYPGVDPRQLQAARPIRYAARDGTNIPGYLTTPPGDGKGLPLVVLPHGGPGSRDEPGFDFLRQFLVGRGYAVLQMNFRGSSGFGEDWLRAARQDWGGLTYDDVVDGTRWAVSQGIADPSRIAVVGWSFGGYVALLGGHRNPELYRCSASIAGVSDLRAMVDRGYYFLQGDLVKEQIGTDRDKLARDSPRLHAAKFGGPVLLVHGTYDVQVPFEQSDGMHKALVKAGRSSRLVPLPKGTHDLYRGRERTVLLEELEAFLKPCLASRN